MFLVVKDFFFLGGGVVLSFCWEYFTGILRMSLNNRGFSMKSIISISWDLHVYVKIPSLDFNPRFCHESELNYQHLRCIHLWQNLIILYAFSSLYICASTNYFIPDKTEALTGFWLINQQHMEEICALLLFPPM